MAIKLTREDIDEIQEIITKYKCPLDFKCYTSGFEDLCGTLMVYSSKLVECVDADAKQCRFSFPFGSSYLCTCPLRLYIARRFHK